MKKLWISMIVTAVAVTATQADTYIVSDSGKGGDPEAASITTWLSANFTAAELGTVTVDEFYGLADVPAAGAGDLVIFTRTLNNGSYDDAGEVAAWNGLAAGILMLSPFQTDDDNLGWVTTTAQNTILSSPVGAETTVTADSLYNLVTVTAGKADLITDGISYKAAQTAGFTYTGTDVLGTATMTAADDSIVLARIAAGSAWSAPGANGAPSGTHAGDRIVFNFLRNPGDMTDLTADGQQVLGNSISELLGVEQRAVIPEPATMGLFGVGALVAVFIRRRF